MFAIVCCLLRVICGSASTGQGTAGSSQKSAVPSRCALRLSWLNGPLVRIILSRDEAIAALANIIKNDEWQIGTVINVEFTRSLGCWVFVGNAGNSCFAFGALLKSEMLLLYTELLFAVRSEPLHSWQITTLKIVMTFAGYFFGPVFNEDLECCQVDALS